MEISYRQGVLLFVSLFLFLCPELKGQSTAADSLIIVLNDTDEDTTRVNLMIRISVLQTLNSPKSALEYAVKAVGEARESGSGKHYLHALRNAGTVCFYAGLLEEAARYGNESLTQARLSGTKTDIAYAFVNLSAIRMAKNYSDSVAAGYLIDAIQLISEVSAEAKSYPDPSLSGIYNNLGQYYKSKGNLAAANDCFRSGIRIARASASTQSDLVRLLISSGDILLAEEQYDSALRYLSDARELSVRSNEKMLTSVADYYLGLWYDAKKMHRKALDYYRLSFDVARELDAVLQISEVAQKISESYRLLGPADSALRYLDISKEYGEKSRKMEAVQEIERRELLTRFQEWEEEIHLKNERKQQNYLIAIGVILLTLLLTGFLYFRTRRNKRRMQLQQMEMELAAQKLQLESDLMKARLDQQDKELAMKVMTDLKRNDIIGEAVEKLLIARRKLAPEKPEEIGRIITHLEKTKEEKVWEEFDIRFLQVHQHFYERLQALCPNLTPNERRLCSFLRMNMATKEIAAMTGQSVASIEKARNRLRKKLMITNQEVGLVEYIASI